MPSSNADGAIERILKAMRQADQSGNQTALLRLYEKYIKIRPEDPQARAEAARLYLKQGAVAKAEPHVTKALEMRPDAKIDRTLFPTLSIYDHYFNNLEFARTCYIAHPNEWRLQLFAKALIKSEEFAEAEHLLTEYLKKPQEPSIQNWILSILSETYHSLRRFPEAIACAQLVLEAKPNDRDALLQIGKNHERLCNYNLALEHFKRLLELDKDDADAHRHIASLMLKIGSFSEGWKHWEWRWAKSLAKQAQNFPIPEWQGQDLRGKTLIVWAEQGVGDEIMFSSMLPDISALGGVIYYECDKRLIPLFSRKYSEINFIANTYKPVKRWPKADYHIPAGGLCRIFRPTLESFREGHSYLSADEINTAIRREKYKNLFPRKKLVGISWRGGYAGTNKFSRSLQLEDLAMLSQLENIQLINLQYGNTEKERATLKDEFDVDLYHDEDVDPMKDIDAQAAQISSLDAVITIDNTTAHLAGALGIPSYVILPLDPDWRWGLESDKSYWYQSLKLIRNNEFNDWNAAVKRVKEFLITDITSAPPKNSNHFGK